MTRRSKRSEPALIWRGEMKAVQAAGSQIMMAFAPLRIWLCTERRTAASATRRHCQSRRTLPESSSSSADPAMAAAEMGSAMSRVASENGPMAMPTGSKSGRVEMMASASSRARLPAQAGTSCAAHILASAASSRGAAK